MAFRPAVVVDNMSRYICLLPPLPPSKEETCRHRDDHDAYA
jgi:hypothetical protein